jgi:short-subunit dehydrogenase
MKPWFALTSAGVAASMTAVARRRPPDDIAGEVAVITGASRGLGLVLAHELARHSVRLVICARDSEELSHAASELRAAGADVTPVAADLDEAGTPERLVETAVQQYGRLDILVNNAGLIQVGPVQNTTARDYETAVRTMALAPVRLTLAALPVLREQEHGRIVNITSIGGKVSVPHLLPYSVAKFAAVAFSEGLRAELGRGPVTVTTVVPGLMRTGSQVNAQFGGQRDAEYTWFSLGASLPMLSMDADRAARQIVGAMRRRRAELILTPLGQLAARGAGVLPGLTSLLLHAMNQLLPDAAGENSGTVPGGQLKPALDRRVFDRLTTLGRAASRQFNESS